ncbi:hypothetical protein FT663_02744 [Candidozyma haemuli var. vulneris]|nr:hypothetical protein FT662_02729 [[Candida] haemuloni var. vulneris]KAF3991446.1 hypothetical protein FT663_02744 [[Candida] haemuloni var. vulneris]
MSQPPFPNEYNKRLVGAADEKACVVCYKPTQTVLLAANKADFFYICAAHLKDVSFASPVHPERYNELLEQRKTQEKSLVQAREQVELNKPYAWDKLVSWGKKKDKDEDTKDDKDKPKKSYESHVSHLEQVKKELGETNDQIAAFDFKCFKLDKNMYKARVNSHIQARVRSARQKEMQNPSYFPSVPTGTPQKP